MHKLLSAIFISVFFVLLAIKYSFAFGYIQNSNEIDDLTSDIGVIFSEIELDSKGSFDTNLFLFQSGLYMQADYPTNESLTYYFQLGAADGEVQTTASQTVFDDGYRPWLGLGVEGVLGEGLFSLGYFAEGKYFGHYKDKAAGISLGLENFWSATQ